MKKKTNTVRFSLTPDLKHPARKESRTDMERLRRMTAAELETSIAGDPESNPEVDWGSVEAVVPPPKRLLSLRLDADVIDWFRTQGPGYQTRMNNVLRSYMQHEVGKRARG